MIIEPMKPSSDQLQKKNVYIVKIETTGLESDDEILELCVLDARNPWRQGARGKEAVPLYHSRFRPEYKASWPRATQVNGISPAMVAKAPFLSDCRSELLGLFMHCDCLVSFNAGFDFPFLRRQFMFRANIMTIDLMRDWTDFLAKTEQEDSQKVDMPFRSQEELFRHFSWPQGKGMLSDCLGLRHCFLQMIPMGCIHIRKPLQERRFARSAAQQLGEIQESFGKELAKAGIGSDIGPVLEIREQDDVTLAIRIAMRDDKHLLFAELPQDICFSINAIGSAGEVRKRLADALAATEGLPEGLKTLLLEIVRGERDGADEEGQEGEMGQDGQDGAAGRAEEADEANEDSPAEQG